MHKEVTSQEQCIKALVLRGAPGILAGLKKVTESAWNQRFFQAAKAAM